MVLFLPNIKFFRYEIGIQFNSTPLVVKQNDNATINAYIVYEVGNCQKVSLNKLTLKNCLFDAIIIVKHSKNSMCIVAMEWNLMD